ncbi:cytosolic phospholipase A2 gamma [Pelodytes ibericus]
MAMTDGENIAISERMKKVFQGFQKLGIETKQDDVPVVAILGSGGSLRAMISLLGILVELSDQGFLDTITYICGTSGSTWCMSSLYNCNTWSTCMSEMEHNICERLSKTEWNWKKSWEKIKKTWQEDVKSLTAVWAYVVICMMTKETNEYKLSDHRSACENGTNPYPVYSAVEKSNLDRKMHHEPGTWFEFTPHNAGFPAYNCFVSTDLLGSQFKEGKLLKTTPERDLCFLQGLWGSAIASKEAIWGILKGHIGEILSKGECRTAGTDEQPDLPCAKCRGCKSLKTLLSEEQQSMDYKVKEQLLLTLTQILDENMSMESEGAFNMEQNSDSETCEIWKVIHQSLVHLAKWEWGTTHNFVYNPNNSGSDSTHISNQEYLYLIDAGLEINSAYPLMLPPHRKVDLILSFDFSEGDPFMTLKRAAEYCEKNKIPFPTINIEKLDDEERSPSKTCYVFEENEKDVPVVMHFPLFNIKNCGDKVHEWREKYATFKLSYTTTEVEELLQAAKQNVKLSKNVILEKLQQVKKDG